jgi:demethylmenaquinone methyltransferase / 2-methoxy-6-polyprenyl-1,4-benzoquinol methylase
MTVSEGGGGKQGTALELFQGLAGSYDRTADFATMFQDRYWKKWATRWVLSLGGALILDLGCGTLLLEERLAKSECRFVGLDLTEEMLAMGSSKRLPNVKLLANGDAEALPFKDRAFDSVMSCYVAKYVDVGRLSRELARVSKRGATVVMYDFAKPHGLTAPFLQLYMQGGLGAAGYLMKLARMRSALTFNKLPSLVNGTSWDSEIVQAMEARGFETLEARRLSGGVVFGYCGRNNG